MKFRSIKKVCVFSMLLVALAGSESYAQSWFPLGTGSRALKVINEILTICSDTDGNIYTAGGFRDTPSTAYSKFYVARWDNALHFWSKLGTGSNALNANDAIKSVCADKYGNIYAAGYFTDITFGGSPAGFKYVAKWDGTTWSKLGTGAGALNAHGMINSICVDRVGWVYAAGHFRNAAGRQYVAKWNGTAWIDLGNLNANLFINSICVDDSNNVYAGGNFTDAAGHAYVAKYSPTTNSWSELGSGFDSAAHEIIINSIFSDSINHVCAGVNFRPSTSSIKTSNVFKWSGSSWSQLGLLNGNNVIHSICRGDSGAVYAGGEFINTSGNIYVAKYDPQASAWHELGAGTHFFDPHLSFIGFNGINALCTDGRNNNLYAGGTMADSVSPSDISICVVAYGVSKLGIVDIPNDSGCITSYPNPVREELTIKLGEENKLNQPYYIYNIYGSLMFSGLLANGIDTKIAFTEIPLGEYILQLNCRRIKITKL